MSLVVLAVVIELSAGLLLLGWGAASAVHPELWRWRGARWWVDRTRATVSRVHGLGVGLVGAAVAVSAPAPLVISPAMLGGVDARSLEVVGLVLVLLGGFLLALSYPTPRGTREAREDDTPEHDDTVEPDSSDLSPTPVPALASAAPTL